jgi:hypothetical protein
MGFKQGSLATAVDIAAMLESQAVPGPITAHLVSWVHLPHPSNGSVTASKQTSEEHVGYRSLRAPVSADGREGVAGGYERKITSRRLLQAGTAQVRRVRSHCCQCDSTH